jgi:hypothetical protein
MEEQMKTLQDVQTGRGIKMVDADGGKIGTIEDIFLDRHTGEPAWAAVKPGLFGHRQTFVPIRDAEVTGDNEVRVGLQKEKVKGAPRVDAKGELTPEEERKLWEYYGLTTTGRATTAPGRWRSPTRTRTAHVCRRRTQRPAAARRRSSACGCGASWW